MPENFDPRTPYELRSDRVAEQIAEAKFSGWLASSLKNWLPISIIFISAIAFFVTQSNRIEVLANQYNTVNERVDGLSETQSELTASLARIEERTIQIQKDIDFIKGRLIIR